MNSPSDLPSKSEYFRRFAQSVSIEAWKMHKDSGHFGNGSSKGIRKALEEKYPQATPAKPGRQGVLEHVLVVAARANVLSDLLGQSEEVRGKLRTAAILHDAGKYEERLLMQESRSKGTSEWDAYDLAAAHTQQRMLQRGFSEDVVNMANSAGHTTIPNARTLAEKEELSPAEIAWLALHYVDDITRGSELVGPATINPDTNVLENDLDRRMQMNRENKTYDSLNQEGLKREGFEMLTFDAQEEVGHLVEERLFNMILANSHDEVLRAATALGHTADQPDPALLPEIIDHLVRSQYQE